MCLLDQELGCELKSHCHRCVFLISLVFAHTWCVHLCLSSKLMICDVPFDFKSTRNCSDTYMQHRSISILMPTAKVTNKACPFCFTLDASMQIACKLDSRNLISANPHSLLSLLLLLEHCPGVLSMLALVVLPSLIYL